MFEPIPPSSLLKIYKGCSNCRTQKIKCNGQEPCSRCRAFGLQCQYIVLPNQAAHRLAAIAAGGGGGGGGGGGVSTPNIIPASPTAASPTTLPSPATAARTSLPSINTSSATTLSATTSPTPSPTTPLATNSTTNTIASWSTDDSITSGSRITSSIHSPNSRVPSKFSFSFPTFLFLSTSSSFPTIDLYIFISSGYNQCSKGKGD
ncbi:MAG: hypothetical protein J3R72DRAFT_239191 [Linnemannia gamsii]|nr:MAG: hypothetical protein J3R72DRAFT_239191 [Linnemannia gamsii]